MTTSDKTALATLSDYLAVSKPASAELTNDARLAIKHVAARLAELDVAVSANIAMKADRNAWRDKANTFPPEVDDILRTMHYELQAVIVEAENSVPFDAVALATLKRVDIGMGKARKAIKTLTVAP